MILSLLRNFHIFLILLNSFAVLGQSGADKKKPIPIEIVVGVDKIEKLDFAPDPQVNIGKSSVLGFVLIPQKREIILKGISSGTTNVIIKDTFGTTRREYRVTVTSDDKSKLLKELKDFLGNVEGLEIGRKGDTIYIEGNMVVPHEIGRVVKVLNQEKFAEVLFLVELSPQTERMVARKMQEEIQKESELKGVTVRVVNHLYWIEGIVSSEGLKRQAEDIAKAFYPDRIASLAERTGQIVGVKKSPMQNFIKVNQKKTPPPIPKLIKITAQFVELVKNYQKTFGFKWTPLLSTGSGQIDIGRTVEGGVRTNSKGTLRGTISNLFPKLSSAKQAGHARVIQSGIVITKNKKTGTISKSESRPFSLGSGEFTQSNNSQASFTIAATPEILKDEKINLKMDVKVQFLAGNPPITTSNNVNTEVVIKSKESAVIGGVSFSKSNTEYDRLPPDETQGGSPLFNFVRGKLYLNEKTQFVIFVTPEILESASTGTEKIKRKFRKRGR